jgi:predicted DNA-binding protein (MmcQ/YjbR family)
VRGRTFGYYLNDHHGDGIVAFSCKVGPGENDLLARLHPERFYIPSYLGPRGWVALRLDPAEVDWGEVADLVTGSYRLVAPKRLAERAGA